MSGAYRVTQRSMAVQTVLGLQGNLSRVSTIQAQMSSGKVLQKPSDSPTGAVTAMQYRSQIRASEQYSRNGEDGLGWLGVTDTTVTGALAAVRKVRDLTVQGMSTGANGQTSREALAAEVDQLRESLIDQANTQYLGRPIFGGTTAATKAYDKDGTYVGNSDPVTRTVGNEASVRVDLTGPEVFGDGDTGLFATLGKIADNLRNNPDALGDNLSALDTSMQAMLRGAADVGARYNHIEQMNQATEDRMVNLRASLSGVEDIDIAKSAVDLQLAQTAYQAALAATSKVITPSLVEFLK